MVHDEGVILMWAAKWYGKKKMMYMQNKGFSGGTRMVNGNKKEKECLAGLWELMDEADIIVGHNGDRFDIPMMNGYFIRNGFTPPSTSRSVDTLKIARNRFKFMSNRLDHLGKTLGLGRKVTHTGFKLWLGCMAGDKKDWATMTRYNIQDVMLLEKIYKKFLPWIKNHPNIGVYLDLSRPVCRNCGSHHIVKKGIEHTNGGVYQRFKCNKCGAPLRGKTNQIKRNPNILI